MHGTVAIVSLELLAVIRWPRIELQQQEWVKSINTVTQKLPWSFTQICYPNYWSLFTLHCCRWLASSCFHGICWSRFYYLNFMGFCTLRNHSIALLVSPLVRLQYQLLSLASVNWQHQNNQWASCFQKTSSNNFERVVFWYKHKNNPLISAQNDWYLW